MVTNDRRPTDRPVGGEGTVSPASVPVNTVPCGGCCGDCVDFLVLNCPPDAPLYFCNSEKTKTLVPPIGWLRGPDARLCKYFVPVDAVSPGRSGPRSLSIQERFLVEPDQFVDVATAAHLLRRSISAVYLMVDDGELESVRVGDRGRIFIYRPSLLRIIVPNQAA